MIVRVTVRCDVETRRHNRRRQIETGERREQRGKHRERERAGAKKNGGRKMRKSDFLIQLVNVGNALSVRVLDI